MHPQLVLKNNGPCNEIILLLEQCHQSSLWNKLSGKCNPLKKELEHCLSQEFEEKRKKNAANSKEKKQRFEERWKRINGE